MQMQIDDPLKQQRAIESVIWRVAEKMAPDMQMTVLESFDVLLGLWQDDLIAIQHDMRSNSIGLVSVE